MKNNFYKFLKYKGKPSPGEISEQYVECYKKMKALNPFTTKGYVTALQQATKELKQIETVLESMGGSAIGGVVSFNQKAVKKFIKN